MPYNLGMTEITLALPYALPPPEMAPDLMRALKMPALAALLSRNNNLQYHIYDNDSRVLPHESWLAHELGLASPPDRPDTGAPLAIAAMRGCGLQAEAAEGHWFMVQPAHIQLSRTHLLLSDLRALHLTEAESRGLYDIARGYFEELGKPLLHGAPGLWFVRADDWTGLSTATPDAAATQNLSDWMPEGEHARDYRKLQNEIQMLWHEHPINVARQERGLQPVNSFWMWGGSHAAPAAAAAAIAGGPAWMQALAAPDQRQPSAAQLIAQPGTVVLAELIPSAQTGDWSDWIARMQRIEQEWFAPLLAALNDGRVGRVNLMLSHRNGWMTVAGGKLAQRKFWRKPTLNSLKQA
ncbi:hypothetical protein GW587_10490 [Duganella sp. SAP-35]|uniref:Phosphoglycerate mutase n=2 Tax=Duganella aceris TaxID=2703883 RepID=A0ABX0FJG2_9BURK|nr:hypothetical protein [Duganella aceris]